MIEPARRHRAQCIVTIKPCCIGDCVMALPALDSLIAAYPESRHVVLVGAHSASVFRSRQPHVDVRVIPDQPVLHVLPQLAWAFRRLQADQVVVLDRSRVLRLACSLAGYPKITQAETQKPEQRHETDVYLDVLRTMGVIPTTMLPTLPPDTTHDALARRLTPSSGRPYIVLQAGGAQNPGTEMLDKRWPAERFAHAAKHWSSSGYDILLTGGPQDRGIAMQIATLAGIPESQILAGRADLLTSAAIARNAALYVGGDTGMSHIAAATGAPCVVIFGPTNPRRYRPLGKHVEILAPASSWTLPDVDLRKSETRTDSPSTLSIRVDDVLKAGARLLATQQGATTA